MGGGNSKKDKEEKKKAKAEEDKKNGIEPVKKVKFKVGQTVFCKNKGDQTWTKGTVVSSKPLLIDGVKWDEVVHKIDQDGAGVQGEKKKEKLDEATEIRLKGLALQVLSRSTKDNAADFNKAWDWLHPAEFDKAVDDFKTSEIVKDMPYSDQTALKALAKYIKEGNPNLEDAPNFHADPTGAQKWAEHNKHRDKNSGVAKKEFLEKWKRLKKEFGEEALKIKEESRVCITRDLYASQGDKYKIEKGWKGTVVSIDKGNALVSFDHPSVEKYVCEKQFKYLRIMKIAHKDRHEPGAYVVDTENLTVDSELDRKKSKSLGKLPRGRRIVVVEVVKQHFKLRGRIAEFPGPGWITLGNLHSGKRWAVCTVPGVPKGVYKNDVRQDVYEGVEPTSKHLHKLDAGLNVNVVEIVSTANGHGLRGRIVSPYTGWITIMWDGSEFAQLEEADGNGSDAEGQEAEKDMHPAVLDNRQQDAFGNVEDYIVYMEGRLNGISEGNKDLRAEVTACRKKKKEKAKSNNTPKSAH